MNRRILWWSIATLAAAAIIVGSCRKFPDPFEPIAWGHGTAASSPAGMIDPAQV
jgi:hypothetical protein